METRERKKRLGIIRFENNQYLELIKTTSFFSPIEKDFRNLSIKLQALSRKNFASENSFKSIPTISNIIFGLFEVIKQRKLPNYNFQEEIELINEYLIKFLEHNINTLYNGQCKYGESLLNGYLDIFIRSSVLKTDKQIEAYPTFLINPATGQNLEIDILFEDFKLGFELQGHESHYSKPNVINKDRFKLRQSFANKTILIPVNNFQLNSTALQELIVNAIKDFLGLDDVIKLKIPKLNIPSQASNQQLMQFSKVAQKLFLSKKLYGKALLYWDTKALNYLTNELRKRPTGISNTTPAPTFIIPNNHFNIEEIYESLKYIKLIRKKLK